MTTVKANQPTSPSLPWRMSSTVAMSVACFLSRSFLFGACKSVEVQGLDEFLQILDQRKDIEGRERGLLTVSNHISVLDDPLLWGVLPLRYAISPDNLRWTLGSYDICFKNKPSSMFFFLGQVLPTHRLAHSPHGGLFQPTMTQCIRLLSRAPFMAANQSASTSVDSSISSPDISDPFSSSHLTYTTNGIDTFPTPSAYLSRRHSWIHIFPEGKVHQHPDKILRYFKWGVARLILEAEPLPQIVPIWIEGFNEVMHEARTAPRWVPRAGKTVKIVFGKEIDGERVFGDLRSRWRMLRRKDEEAMGDRGSSLELGVLTEQLKYGREAVELRIECAKRMREEILSLRRKMGLPDEDPKTGLAETWLEEGKKREGLMGDGSLVRDV